MKLREISALTVALAVAASMAAAGSLVIFAGVLQHIATNAYGATGDFLSFYAAGFLVRTGQGAHLYEPAVIEATQRHLYPGGFDEAIGYPLPVFAAWLFAPLSRLPFTTAFFLYMSLMACLLGGLLWLLGRELNDLPARVRWLFLACAAFAMPSLATIVFGQVDLIALAGLLGGYLLLRADRRVLAGLTLCLVLIKPHFLIGVALLLLLRRDWRTMGTLAGAGLALLIVPALLTGPSTLFDNVKELATYSSGGRLTVNAQFMANWRGFIDSATNSDRLIYWAPGSAIIAAGAIAVALLRWRSGSSLERDYSIAVLLPLIASPHVHTQSLVLMLLPATLALRAYVTANSSAEAMQRATNVLLLSFTLLFVLPVMAIIGLSLTGFFVLAVYLGVALRWPAQESIVALGDSEKAPRQAYAA